MGTQNKKAHTVNTWPEGTTGKIILSHIRQMIRIAKKDKGSVKQQLGNTIVRVNPLSKAKKIYKKWRGFKANKCLLTA